MSSVSLFPLKVSQFGVILGGGLASIQVAFLLQGSTALGHEDQGALQHLIQELVLLISTVTLLWSALKDTQPR